MTLHALWLLGPLAFAVTAAGCLDWGKLEAGRCGDGFVGPEEGCDDGNRKPGDGCDEDCEPEPAVCGDATGGAQATCDAGGPRPTDAGCDVQCAMAEEPVCGNAAIEAGEDCDDGNRRAGDGCDERCRREPERPLCGNGMLDDDEVCDDANESNADACLNGCSRATCGDGQVRTHVEECDVVSGDDVSTCKACLLCPPEPAGYFDSRTRHCYTRHAERVSQGAARRICQAEGGDLWTVTSADEANVAVARLSLSGTHWLGRVRNAGVDAWVTGEPTKFSNYAEGEPRLPNGPCIALRADGAANAWRSDPCALEQRFVCERSAPSISLPSNRAYKVRTAALTADEARSRCVEEGGHLATLETADEQAYVAGITRLTVWVDARESAEGVFAWAGGEALPPDSVQVDDIDGTQGCLTLQPTGQLVDRACIEAVAFVCELD